MAKKSSSPGTSLVIVESPAKARTINRYLGSGFEVMASMGHVRDLPVDDLGIDLDRGFEPRYEILAGRRKVVGSLRKAAANCSEVYLATDLDREGEAIAWHLIHALGLEEDRVKRVVFNEITKSAIRAAFADPHQVDMDKVNAQQARRLLDRIVGYQLSPLLQMKIGRGLSAGRVQSVAVRLIVDREREIRAFVPTESWRITTCLTTETNKAASLAGAWADFLDQGRGHGKNPSTGPTIKARNAWLAKHHVFTAELVRFNGTDFRAVNVAEARKAAEALGFQVTGVDEHPWESYSRLGLRHIELKGVLDPRRFDGYRVIRTHTRRTSSRPAAPFTTASLQQAASGELGFAPSRTMRIAQQLYEGVDLGGSDGPVGLITYMRTDSTNISKESVDAVRTLIRSEFGDRYVPSNPNVFGQSKRAQEAHEAIRPSDASRRPAVIKGHVPNDLFKLYDLIWRRFVACQMTPAEWDATSAQVATDTPEGEAVFRSTGRRLVFDGYLRVSGADVDGEMILPEIREGQLLSGIHLQPNQQFTSPPARYTEAALVKKLESEGIGRPSTYASIIQTIQDRAYVELVDRKLHPTQRGEMVTDKLVEHFPSIMDVKFTSFMEEELDKIEEAHLDWVHVLAEFYDPFKTALNKAQVEMERPRAEPSDFPCPECGKVLLYRMGRNGRFLSCSGYPDCRVSMNIDAEGRPVRQASVDLACVKCGRPMQLKRSRLGPFLGCSGYPECTHTVPADEEGRPLRRVEPEEIEENCPECNEKMKVRFARGKAFLGCTGYPQCKATKPLPAGVFVEKPKPESAGVRCDKCGRDMVKRGGRRGPFLSCSGFPRCRNAVPLDKLDHLRALEAAGQTPPPPAPDSNGKGVRGRRGGRTGNTKVDVASLGAPPTGFAWTRTGRPVVEDWPEQELSCPDCGGEAVLRRGRFGPYFGCSRYPKCSFVANLRGDAKKRAELEMPAPARPKPVPTDVPCDECGSPMLIRTGRTGPFLGCSRYPKCRFSRPLPEGMSADQLTATAERT